MKPKFRLILTAVASLLIANYATAGGEEIKLGERIIAVTSEDQYERLVVVAEQNDQNLLKMMLEEKQAVFVAKGKTVVLDGGNAEITQDPTGGKCKFRIKGTQTPLWTTNHMLQSALWAAD
jgi:endonuclease YncB( thermonuclease family)